MCNARKIKESIEQQCEDNPFFEDIKWMNIATNLEDMKSNILKCDTKGQERFEEFICDRLVQITAIKSVWDAMTKLKLKTFSTTRKKTTSLVQNKVINLRGDHQLLARFLIIQQSRPNLVQDMPITIGEEIPLVL